MEHFLSLVVQRAISLETLVFSWYDTKKIQVTSGILHGTPLESVPQLVRSWWLTTVFAHFISLILLRRFEALNLLEVIFNLAKSCILTRLAQFDSKNFGTRNSFKVLST